MITREHSSLVLSFPDFRYEVTVRRGLFQPMVMIKTCIVKRNDWTLKKGKMYYYEYLYLDMSWRIYVVLPYIDKVPFYCL